MLWAQPESKMKYKVQIQQITVSIVEVDANSEDDAIEIAEDGFDELFAEGLQPSNTYKFDIIE